MSRAAALNVTKKHFGLAGITVLTGIVAVIAVGCSAAGVSPSADALYCNATKFVFEGPIRAQCIGLP